tara:strand:+ start:139 stop:612 length:474 start_codon:yes stop_codon:yes gene_type:complete
MNILQLINFKLKIKQMNYSTIKELDTVNDCEHIVCYEDSNGLDTWESLLEYERSESLVREVILHHERTKDGAVEKLDSLMELPNAILSARDYVWSEEEVNHFKFIKTYGGIDKVISEVRYYVYDCTFWGSKGLQQAYTESLLNQVYYKGWERDYEKL